MVLQGTNPKTRVFHVTTDEREKFMVKNVSPKNEAEAYIWFAFENSVNGAVYLYDDEAAIAAEMARQAGCVELAARLQ